MGAKEFCKEFWSFWKTYVLMGTPLFLMPWPIIYPTLEVKTAYAVIIMSVFWMTEVIPIAVTSLLPVVLFPMLGIMKSSDVCPNYMKDTIMLFMGGLLVAVAVEKSNLHKRIALRSILLVGTKPRWLMLGFMLPTWFLSMWISNTATTSMMVPIVEAVLNQLKRASDDNPAENGDGQKNVGDGKVNLSYKEDEIDGNISMSNIKVPDSLEAGEADIESARKETASELYHKKMCKAMSLCICYSATVGGIATLTGTPPNLVLVGQADILFQKYGLESPVTFASWMLFSLPVSVITLIIAWLWLQTWFLGCCKSEDCCCSVVDSERTKAIQTVIKNEYAALGPFRFEEVAVLIHFILLALFWLTRFPQFVDGWSTIFLPKYVSDATPAILIACMLFIFPAKRPTFFCCRAANDDSKPGPRQPLLDWDTASRKMPWSVVLLLGGGFAMAKACQTSGLSEWIGNQLIFLAELPDWAIVLLTTLIVAAATEVTSNTATATLLMPIIGELAINLGTNPLYLMLPACLAASFAFMLPVATPPNAIVFSYGHLRVVDMAAAGFLMNVVGVLVVTLAVETWGKSYFDLGTLPVGFSTSASSTAVSWNFTTMNPCVTV